MEEKTDKVVGYIEYLGAGGIIGEIVPYTSVEKFKDEILDSLDCGRPVTPVSNLANGIEPSIEKTRNMQIQLEQQLASAEEEVKRPFPQATELTEKSKRLAVLEGLLNMNDKDIVTDTDPEQQCQTDNRQRGQEER